MGGGAEHLEIGPTPNENQKLTDRKTWNPILGQTMDVLHAAIEKCQTHAEEGRFNWAMIKHHPNPERTDGHL